MATPAIIRAVPRQYWNKTGFQRRGNHPAPGIAMLEHANGDRSWRDPKTSTIIGAAIEVHKRLGNGFLEVVYLEAAATEFKIRGIPFRREVSYPVYYKDQPLGCSFRVDFLCFDDVVVEVKALNALTTTEFAQVLNYLRASGNTRGLLLNFGTRSLEFKRVVLNYDQRRPDG